MCQKRQVGKLLIYWKVHSVYESLPYSTRDHQHGSISPERKVQYIEGVSRHSLDPRHILRLSIACSAVPQDLYYTDCAGMPS